MSKSLTMFRRDILNKNLTRPNWIKQEHRSLHKAWLDKNECADPEMNKIVMQSLLKMPAEAVFSYPELDVLYRKVATFSRWKHRTLHKRQRVEAPLVSVLTGLRSLRGAQRQDQD